MLDPPYHLTVLTTCTLHLEPPGSLLGLDGEHATQLQNGFWKGKGDEEMHQLDSFQGC